MKHASQRVIPAPSEIQEEFNSDDFFENDYSELAQADSDEEIGSGYDFAAKGSGIKRVSRLLGLR